MLNYLWAFMILIGIIYAAFTGNLPAVTEAALDSAREAVSLCITMAGVLAFWVGLMKIAEDTGLLKKAADKIYPLLHFLFPKIPKGHPAMESIAANCIANFFGLGWAATPAGLQAMKELEALEEDRRVGRAKGIGRKKGTASNEMCNFLILNISSLQLIPMTIIAYRSQYGSADPMAIVGPGIAATAVSTLTAIIFCKIADHGREG